MSKKFSKKFLSAVIAFFIVGISAFAEDTFDLDNAIQSAAQSIKAGIPAGSILAVGRFSSDTENLSDYIQTNMESALKRQGFSIVEKNEKNLKALNDEIDYQYDGNVADEFLVEVGKQVGAQYFIHGRFEQLGNYMSLYVRASNLSTMESPVIETYAIRSSTKVNELLGEAKKLETASDFLDAIARCRAKLLSIQREKDKEITRSSTSIRSKYQEQINAVNKWAQDPWESDDEFASRKSAEISSIEKKRDTEIKGEQDRITIQYNNMTRSVEISEREIKSKLEQTKFVLKGVAQVNVFVGNFERNSKPKHWPVNIKSLDELVPFKDSAKHEINDADLRTEFNAFEEAKKNEIIEGEITYSIRPHSADNDFDVIVLGYKVFNIETGSVYLNTEVNRQVRVVSASTNVTKTQNRTTVSPNSKKKQDNSKVSTGIEKSESHSSKSTSNSSRSVSNTSRVSDSFGVKYILLSDWQDYTLHGLSLNAFSSNFGHFFVDWLNADVAFGSDAMYFGGSVDAGWWLGLGSFFPFVKAGVGGFSLSYKLDNSSSYDEVEWNDWEEDVSSAGVLAKIGVGAELKLSDNMKLVALYDMHLLFGAYNMASDSFSFGLCFGKPQD